MKAASVEPGPDLIDLAGGKVDWRYTARVSTPMSADAITWARATLQGAPLTMRIFLVIGWAALLMQGRSRSDATHVLGWPITRTTTQTTVLQRHSLLGIHATLVFVTQPDAVTFSSAMAYNSFGRVVWAAVAPIHRWAVRVLLSHAPGAIAALGR